MLWQLPSRYHTLAAINQSSPSPSLSLSVFVSHSFSCFSICIFCRSISAHSLSSVENCLFYLLKACSLASLAIFDTLSQVIDCRGMCVCVCVLVICSINCCKYNLHFQSMTSISTISYKIQIFHLFYEICI